MMVIKSSTGILTINIREMGILNTHSPVYYMKYACERTDLILDTYSRQNISD